MSNSSQWQSHYLEAYGANGGNGPSNEHFPPRLDRMTMREQNGGAPPAWASPTLLAKEKLPSLRDSLDRSERGSNAGGGSRPPSSQMSRSTSQPMMVPMTSNQMYGYGLPALPKSTSTVSLRGKISIAPTHNKMYGWTKVEGDPRLKFVPKSQCPETLFVDTLKKSGIPYAPTIRQ
eukprot:gnl/TRDRNA2_/TRDRNA2_182620_c0_seq1.p1 gnl/TRDRNA2_/TRDRNA2_182620_c0~~gnl/TRDRNA2_/TRDRNA2_182620_c0_seq1.p1  ORF type:complete len:176 (+),score=17.91 gnl/TRDRNA2_/TRDRNA2_182620_c0_seq1:75-602(+)